MAPTSKGRERRSSVRLRVVEERRQSSQTNASARALRAAKRHGPAPPRFEQADDPPTREATTPASNSPESDSEDDFGDEEDDDFIPHAASSRVASLKRRAPGPAVSPGSPDPLTLTPVAKRVRRSTRSRPPLLGGPRLHRQAKEHGRGGKRRDDDASSGDDSSDEENDAAPHSPQTPAPRRRLVRNASSGKIRKCKSPARPKKKNATAVTKKSVRPSTHNTVPTTDLDAVIPPWRALPYFILVNIFRHAADQLPDPARVKWLIATSLVCRDFCEPALAPLYQSPPFLTRPMAHKFIELLGQDPDSTRFNYRQKVEKLRISVREIAKGLYQGNPLDLPTLISLVPRLQVLDFYHDLDLPPFRSLDEGLKWRYPDALFTALGAIPSQNAVPQDQLPDLSTMANPLGPEAAQEAAKKPHVTRLTGWRWNRRMMGPELGLRDINELHMTPSFAGLRRLGFLNYQVPSSTSRRPEGDRKVEDKEYIENFASAINSLPQLEFLTMESSTVVNGDLLAMLPKTLQTLQLINCWEVISSDFADYLVSHGHNLRHLYLLHNQSLSLAFLTVLGEACPRLQTLSMDFRCYQHHYFYNDSDPIYDEILTKDQVPSWPASIEFIELMNMRKWTADAAEMFFKSLIDNAPDLTNLRHIDLKAMLDIPIRQRSAIRDKWTAELKRVFLRKWKPPMPIYSLRDSRKPSQRERGINAKSRELEETRRSSRIATHGDKANESPRAGNSSRGLRDRSGNLSYAEPDSSDSDLHEPDDEIPPDSPKSETRTPTPAPTSEDEGFIHGMCEFVNMKLDNQKPTEQTWSMNDFLDSESDDPADDDWEVAGDRDNHDDRHAW